MAESVIKVIEPDTGWIVLNSNYPLVRYRKIGKIVCVHVKIDTNISGNVDLGTLPLGYRPLQQIRIRNYTGNPYIVIQPNGDVGRLGDGADWINAMITYPAD